VLSKWVALKQGKAQELEGKLQQKEMEIEALRAALAKSGADQTALTLPVEKVLSHFPFLSSSLSYLCQARTCFMISAGCFAALMFKEQKFLCWPLPHSATLLPA
jgi:hypothetical protein